MHFYPTASAANIRAPSCSSKSSQILFLVLVRLFTGSVFVIAAAKSFPGPLLLSRLSTFYPCFYSSGLRCWTLLTPEVKGDLFFFPSPPWFRDSSKYTTASWPEQYCKQETDYRKPVKMKAVSSYYNVLEIAFFWNMLTSYHCVNFSGTTTKMQGLTGLCLWLQTHSTWHKQPWRWLLLGLLLIAKAGTEIQLNSHLLLLASLLARLQNQDFAYKKHMQERLY